VLHRIDSRFTVVRVAPGFTAEEIESMTEMPVTCP